MISPLSSSSTGRLDLVYRLAQAFNSSLHLNKVLDTVIDEVIAMMNAERGFVMLTDKNGQLIFEVARGMDHRLIQEPDFQISRSVVDTVLNEGKPIVTTDAQKDDRFAQQHSIVSLGLNSILCVPLKNKDWVTGIIYVDNRMISGAFTVEDRDLLMSIASSAAIAIENARLFDDLQKSKSDLEKAYDTTLEGWARALELRDQVTEGHTRRVTELTLLLAKQMDIQNGELPHIQRGALLHDIGKMGIPDSILLKSGPLSAQEYDVMKKHCEFAYDMLGPIDFLRPALVIPYCHHERWDGLGYPRGLKGVQIPLAARIFAIVDVWDALTSNRPYRQGWPREKVINYLVEQSGKHFDPVVVQIFIQILKQGLLPEETKK